MSSQLTKREVLRRLQKWGVTGPQLDRWKRAGLLTAPVLHGQGKGQGVKRVWAEDTPARATLIARTLEDDEEQGRKPSLKRAAHILVGAGYQPTADVLRELAQDQLANWDRDLWKRRKHWRKLTSREARARFDDSVERRLPNLPPQAQEFEKRTLAGLAGVTVGNDLLGGVTHHMSIASMQKMIDGAPEDVLVMAVRGATDWATDETFCAAVSGFVGIIGLLDTPAGEGIFAALAAPMQAVGSEAEKVPIGTCEQSATLILMLCGAWLVARDIASSKLGAELYEIAVGGKAPKDDFVPLLRRIGQMMDLGPVDAGAGVAE